MQAKKLAVPLNINAHIEISETNFKEINVENLCISRVVLKVAEEFIRISMFQIFYNF